MTTVSIQDTGCQCRQRDLRKPGILARALSGELQKRKNDEMTFTQEELDADRKRDAQKKEFDEKIKEHIRSHVKHQPIDEAHPLDTITLAHDSLFVELLDADAIMQYLGADEIDLGKFDVGVVRRAGQYVTKVKKDQCVLLRLPVNIVKVSAIATGSGDWLACKETCVKWIVDSTPLDWSDNNRDIDEMEV